MDIDFFDKLVLKKLYIQDHGQDTLLYAPAFKATVSNINFKEQLIQIGDVVLEDAYVNIRKFKREGDFNFQFLIDAFGKSSSTNQSKKSPELLCNNIILKNCRLNYSLMYKKHSNWGVDWDYISLNYLNVNLSSVHTYGDTINTYISNLSFIEKSGFYLSNASCFFKAHSQKMYFKNFEATTKETRLNANVTFNYNTWSDFEDFIDRINITADIKRSKIQMADISYFAEELKGLKKEVYITGRAHGTVNNFTADPILLEFGEKTSIEGKLKMEGLPDIETTLMNFKIKNLYTCKQDIEGIPLPPFYKNEYIGLPNEVEAMGKINYKGDFTGYYNNFVTYGTISSDIGIAKTDVKIDYNLETEITKYSGLLNTQNLNLKKLLSNKNLGNITANLSIEGKGFMLETLDAKAKGTIAGIDLNNYNYKNISIDGNFKNKQFSGKCLINDPNLILDFNGGVNFSPAEPRFAFTADIKDANLDTLNIYNNSRQLFKISTKVEVDAYGNTFDDFKGTLSFEDAKIENENQLYELGEILIHSQETGKGNKKLIIASDLLDVRVQGKYQFSQIQSDVQDLINHHFSNLYSEKKIDEQGKNEDFTFNINLKNTAALSELFYPDVIINKSATLDGSFNCQNKNVSITANIPQASIFGVKVNHLQSNINGVTNDFTIKNTIGRVEINDSIWFDEIKINAHPWNKKLLAEVNWQNKEKYKNAGRIESLFTFNDSSQTELDIRESNIFVRDTNWALVKQGQIIIDTAKITFNELAFSSGTQTISVNGIISKDPQKQLTINLKQFIVANFNPLLTAYEAELNGMANGFITINDVYRKPVFNSKLNLEDFTLNGENFGKGEVLANYDDNRQNVKLNGKFLNGNLPTITFSGMYFPFKKEDDLDLSISLNKTQLKILHRFTDGILSDLKGYATGDILITGSSSNPQLYGNVDIQKGGVKVDYLKTAYTFNGMLNIKPTYFELPNGDIYDEAGTPGTTYFKLSHQNFNKFVFDIRVDAKNMLCLNTTLKDNNLFYGKAYTTGYVKISGPTDKITIDVSSKTEKGTQIFIPYNDAKEVSETSFIKFINKDTTHVSLKKAQKTDLTGLQVNFDLEVTPEALFQMVFDSKVGDVIKGRGQGNIKMDINTNGAFTMHGDYRFTEGDYLFTFENAINKKFKIDPGSLVSWNGDPYNANIDIAAIYKTKTSLATLLQDSSSEYKRNIPVNVLLKLTDKLFNPSISFGINFPTQTNNEALKAQVNTIIGNENNNELNRQVFALLMIGSFIPPSGSSQGATRVSDGIGNSSAELLSAQFNNWISQLSKGVNFGLNYKPASTSGLTSNQVEVAVSTQLFDNRLSIDGNFGVANRQQTAAASSLVDVNVEYKLTTNGKLRLKAYNKPNDFINYFTQGYNKQGVGLIYKEEFNSLSELFKRKTKEPVLPNTPALPATEPKPTENKKEE